MIKWLIVFVLALALIGWFTPLLRRIGLGRLPGDIHFVHKGREYSFPLTSSLVLTALVTWLMYALR
jgi:UDP-N-acetylmuramyl pentapeptide phosphotransferase/UDP-N-acetylglucosamine-1-phosphate transferase